MTIDRLQAIKIRCEKAQKGPWIPFYEGFNLECGDSFIQTGNEDIYLLPGASKEDHEFIASARQDIPKLIDIISNSLPVTNEQFQQIKVRCEHASKKQLGYIENTAEDNQFINNAREDLLWLLENLSLYNHTRRIKG